MSLLEVTDLKKHFPIRTGVLKRTTGHVYAVDGVSFSSRRARRWAWWARAAAASPPPAAPSCASPRPPAATSSSRASTS